MGFFNYLTTASPTFGPLAWLFFIGQILAIGAGAYLYWVHTERNSARLTFMKQLGIALMILGGVGVVSGVLRLLNVPFFNQRLLFWIQALIELLVAGYVFFYMRNVLPGLEKAAVAKGRHGGAPRPPRAVPTDAAPATPRPVATTSRRDARRDRKRKSK